MCGSPNSVPRKSHKNWPIHDPVCLVINNNHSLRPPFGTSLTDRRSGEAIPAADPGGAAGGRDETGERGHEEEE